MGILKQRNFKIFNFYISNIFRNKVSWIIFVFLCLFISISTIATILILKIKYDYINLSRFAIAAISILDILFIIWTLILTSKLFYSEKSSNNEIMLISRPFSRKNIILNKFLCFFVIGFFYCLFIYILKISVFLTVKDKLYNYANWYYLSFFTNLLFYFFFGSFFMVLRTKWSTKISFMILTFSTILIQPLQSITYVIENQSYYFLEDLDSLEKNDLVLTSKFVNKKNNNYQLFIVPKTKNLNLNDDKKSFLDKEKKLIKKAGNNFYILSFFLKFLNPSHEFLFSVQRDYDGKNVFQNFNSNSNINKINDKYWNVFLSQSEEKPPTGKNEIFSLNYIKEKNMLIPGRYFFDVKDDSKKIFENNLKIDIEKFYKVWKNVFNSQSVKNVNDFENAKEIFTKTIEENNFGKIFNKNEFFIATLVFLYENYSENNFLKIFISGILKNNNEIKIKENKFDISKFNFPYSHFKNYPNEKIDIFKNVDEIFVYSQKSFDLIKILILFVFSLSVLFIFITYFSYLKKDNF